MTAEPLKPDPVAAEQGEPLRRTSTRVFIRGLKVDAEIGVYAHERGRAQPLIVDVEVELGDQPIGRLADTFNYEAIVIHAERVASAHVDLVEDYAERLARACLDDPRTLSVRVRVEKPEAISAAEAAGCELSFVRG